MEQVAQFTDESWCWQWSLAEKETLWGTATAEIAVWFLLEYRDRWGAEAVAEANLPPAVGAYLAEVANSQLLLIRQPERRQADKLLFYVGVTGQAIYRFALEEYRDIVALNLEAVIAGDSAYDRYQQEGVLHLVCTNGQRDRCCAQQGMAVFNRLQQLVAVGDGISSSVWQVTHLGGHRFAATTLCLPSGRMYGRLTADNCEQYWTAVMRDEVPLSLDRGLTRWPTVVQVAEWHLRQALGIMITGGWHLVGWQTIADLSQIQLQWIETGQIYQVLVRQTGVVERYMSCQKLRTKPAVTYEYEGYEAIG